MNVIEESCEALKALDWSQIDRTVHDIRNSDRVFVFGNGGGYAHAMHFASDLRKIAKVQAFSFDNLAEITARVNDDGWDDAWKDWRATFNYDGLDDLSFMFSVGGGMDELSYNLPSCTHGIVGKRGGAANRIVIPSASTPVIEGCQSVIAHHIVKQLCA